MATLVSELIQQAFREGNIVAAGEVPQTNEIDEALPRLQNLIFALLGTELGEHLTEWYVPQTTAPLAPYRHPLTPSGIAAASTEVWAYPPANVRLLVKVTEDAVLYFPATPSDGARMAYVDVGSTGDVTLKGNGRLIEGAETVVGTPGTNPLSGRSWFYRADLANWILLKKILVLGDEVPLPEEFDDLLVCGLALRLAPRYGIDQEKMGLITSRFSDMSDKLKKRYRQTQRMPFTDQGLAVSQIMEI